jgi:hypothetical protein
MGVRVTQSEVIVGVKCCGGDNALYLEVKCDVPLRGGN